jgi:hypothetical protein
MTEKIGPYDAERVLGQIPRQLREGRRQDQGRNDGLGIRGRQAAALEAMGREVIGITPTPGGLRLDTPRHLTGCCRARPLAPTDAPVGHKPPTADTAGPLREHPEMLASPGRRSAWSNSREQTWVNFGER